MTVYIALGSNLGDRREYMSRALTEIAGRVGSLSAISSLYETTPWGYESENSFLNQVIRVETPLSPEELLKETQKIEKELGRRRSGTSYQDRVIDIDLILYEELILNTEELILPHPLFHLRRFVLEPLAEIEPDLTHPVLKLKIGELLNNL